MILLCFLFFGHPEPSLARVRGLYKQCVVSEDSCKALLVLLKECDQSNEPLLAGYRAGATMMMAKYAFSPWTKWRCFCQGRDLLERSVAADGQNVELIFIRYSVQQHCPWFLHYRQSVQKDRNFIDAHLEKLNDLALKKEITEYLGKEKT